MLQVNDLNLSWLHIFPSDYSVHLLKNILLEKYDMNDAAFNFIRIFQCELLEPIFFTFRDLICPISEAILHTPFELLIVFCIIVPNVSLYLSLGSFCFILQSACLDFE